MATVYLALGSNVGDSRQYIKQAIEQLGTVLDGLKQAPLYLSKAVGYTDQADFYNTAVCGTTHLTPEELLKAVKKIEANIGRTPTFRNGPREIDIDIIFYDDLILKTEELTIPHPEFANRDFVLQPLADLNPGWQDPRSGKIMQTLLNQLTPNQHSLMGVVDPGGAT